MPGLQELDCDPARGAFAFAERLRRVGEEFDREARQSMDAAVESSQREARLLRDEVEWLQRQLEDEWQQGAMRLGLCTELKMRLSEMQEAHQEESKAREYWQNECAVFEERHSLLEAKLAAVMLTEEERAGLAGSGGDRASGSDAVVAPEPVEGSSATVAEADPVGSSSHRTPRGILEEARPEDEAPESEQFDVSDSAAVERYLQILENDAFSAAIDRRLQRVSVDGLHALLVAAAGRRSDGAGPLLRRIVQLWVGRLLSRSSSVAIRTAIQSGSTETLATLLALGGTSVLASAATAVEQLSGGVSDESSPPACLLRLCVERGDATMLTLVLEHLRGARSGLGLTSVRRALELANSRGSKDLCAALSAHLAVELSHTGNSQYRHGEFEAAIASYEEAIALSSCAASGGGASSAATDATAICSSTSGEALSSGENLVRMRYNLARALHRVDRWAESREQCTHVLDLHPGYINAYALRAQAAMAALDWEAAQADWDRLSAVVACSSQGVTADMLAGWERRQEECARQLALGHYEVLGLPRIASLEAVRRAYKDLARQWHPDKHQYKQRDHQERSQRRFRRIREAYEVLGEESSKREYDASLLLCEARPLSSGHHSSGLGSMFGLGSATKATDSCTKEEGSSAAIPRDYAAERPHQCNSSPPPIAVGRRFSAGTVRINSFDGAPPDLDTAGSNSTAGRKNAQSMDSPLSRWLPNFRSSKASAPEMSVPPIHINLFDAQFVNADAKHSE